MYVAFILTVFLYNAFCAKLLYLVLSPDHLSVIDFSQLRGQHGENYELGKIPKTGT